MSERPEAEVEVEEEDAVEAVSDEGTSGAATAEAQGELASEALAAAQADEVLGEAPARERLEGIVESLLFAAGAPLALKRMVDVLEGPTAKEIRTAVERLMLDYNQPGRGVQLLAVAGGFQLRSAPTNAGFVRALLRERPTRLGRAALETLAIVAYKQPATRAEIEAVRGVDCDSAIATLLARKLVKIAGRKEAVGRPLMYATTSEFLEVFGLNDLTQLPALKEIGPVQEPEDETVIDDVADEWRAAAEDPQSGGSELAASGGAADPGGAGDAERQDGHRAGDEGEPAQGQDRD
jgi:segregation and condensation protein B